MISAIAAFAVGSILIGISFVITYLGMKADPKAGMSYVAGGMLMKMVLGSVFSVGAAWFIPDFNIAAFGLVLAAFLGVGIPANAILVTYKMKQ